jgi:hypothetical protein
LRVSVAVLILNSSFKPVQKGLLSFCMGRPI